MKLKTLKLETQFSGDQTMYSMSYNIGDVESITSGRWQLAISSISLLFQGNRSWNSIFEISSNFIEHSVPSSSGLARKEMSLGFFRVKGNPGEKQVIGFKWRDFFEVNQASRTIILNFKEFYDPADPPLPPPIVPPEQNKRNVYISVLVLIRRVE